MQRRILLSLIVLALILIAFLSCSKEKTTQSVSFKIPGNYRGTYLSIMHWHQPDADTVRDSATFEFRARGEFVMYADALSEVGTNLCSVEGAYLFLTDTLTIDITNNNLLQTTCAPGVTPMGENIYDHYVDQGYLVFEIRDTAHYRKIELNAN